MASRSGSRRTSRDLSTIANPRLRRSPFLSSSYSFMNNIEDRRLYRPDILSTPRSMYQRTFIVDRNVNLDIHRHRRFVNTRMVSPVNRVGMVSSRLTSDLQSFKYPKRVVVCVRRQQRKEVMFAKHYAGRGGQHRPKFNYWSSVTCR